MAPEITDEPLENDKTSAPVSAHIALPEATEPPSAAVLTPGKGTAAYTISGAPDATFNGSAHSSDVAIASTSEIEMTFQMNDGNTQLLAKLEKQPDDSFRIKEGQITLGVTLFDQFVTGTTTVKEDDTGTLTGSLTLHVKHLQGGDSVLLTIDTLAGRIVRPHGRFTLSNATATGANTTYDSNTVVIAETAPDTVIVQIQDGNTAITTELVTAANGTFTIQKAKVDIAGISHTQLTEGTASVNVGANGLFSGQMLLNIQESTSSNVIEVRVNSVSGLRTAGRASDFGTFTSETAQTAFTNQHQYIVAGADNSGLNKKWSTTVGTFTLSSNKILTLAIFGPDHALNINMPMNASIIGSYTFITSADVSLNGALYNRLIKGSLTVSRYEETRGIAGNFALTLGDSANNGKEITLTEGLFSSTKVTVD